MCTASRVYGMQTHVLFMLQAKHLKKKPNNNRIITVSDTQCSTPTIRSIAVARRSISLSQNFQHKVIHCKCVGHSLIIKNINLSSIKFINKF